MRLLETLLLIIIGIWMIPTLPLIYILSKIDKYVDDRNDAIY